MRFTAEFLVAAFALTGCSAAPRSHPSTATAAPIPPSPWLPTSAFALSQTVAGLVDALANFPFRWAPGEDFSSDDPWEKLEPLLTPSQATALLRHESATVRAYMALHVVKLGAYDALEPVLRDSTGIEDQTTDDISTSTVAEQALNAVCDAAKTDPRARGLIERVLADGTFKPAWGSALRCAGSYHLLYARERALALIDTTDQLLQWSAFLALENVATDADAQRMLGILKESDALRRSRAAGVLEHLRGPGVMETLEQLAHKDPDEQARAAAARAYAHHAEARREVLEAMIASADEPVASCAVDGLARRGGPDDLAIMVPYLRRIDWLGSLDVMDAFERPPRRQWLAPMRELTKARASDVRERALKWLGRARDRVALPLARQALRSAEAGEQLGAISAIAALNDKDSVPALVLMLEHADPNIRLASARALTVLHAKSAYEKLVRAAEHETSSQRESMLEACAALRGGREVAVDDAVKR